MTLKTSALWERFQSMYSEGTPPWDIGRPQPMFVRLYLEGKIQGRVLDAGCGTGELALFLAGRGLDVTGVDFIPKAVKKARAKARRRKIRVRFLCGDILDMDLGEASFDTVVDSGLFHVFDDEKRVRYVTRLTRILRPGGHLYLACFSEFEPGTEGPRRVTQQELRESFHNDWYVESIERTYFEHHKGDRHAHAWLMNACRMP